MEAHKQFNPFQFEIIKKEPVDEDEINNKYENNFNPNNQEYYSKPELNLDWDEKYNNVHSVDPENVDGGNTFLKIYNPRVLLERLPESILTKYCLKITGVKTEYHHDEIETSTKFSDNASTEPNGENCALKVTNFSTKRECSKCQKKFKKQLSLQKHLLYCGKLPHLQCSYCTYKTKYKSALKIHTSSQHLAQRRTIKRNFNHSKNLRSLKALKSDLRYCLRKTQISCKNRTVRTKNTTSLSKPLKDVGSKTEKAVACPKCKKKFKYKKSLTKHSIVCNDSSDSGNKPSLYTPKKKEKKEYLKKQVGLKKIKSEIVCPNWDRKFKYVKPFKLHPIKCKAKSYSQCKYCTYKTKYPSNLAQHVSNAHFNKKKKKKKKCQKDEPLACSHCNKQLKSQRTLKIHLLHCGQSVQLQSCQLCGKLYGIRNSLEKHLLVCGKEPRFKCKYCPYKSHYNPDVAKHTVAVHLKKNVNHFLPCSNCGRRYKNQQSLTMHTRRCGKEPRFQCDYCSYKSKTKPSLASHILAVHLEKDKNHFLPCSKCGKRYKNQRSLTGHLSYCGKERDLQCDYCCYKTILKPSLEKHIVAVHLEEKVNHFLPCLKCGKRYKNQQSLSRHEALCGKEPQLQCEHCPYKTNMKKSMEKHIVVVHLEKGVNHFLPCSKCGRRYKNEHTLARHSYLCGKEPDLQCDYCPHKTNMKSSLERHIVAVHLEKKVNHFLPCSKCGKRYKNQRSLTRHEALCGKEPHLQCNYCPYKTNLKPSLEKHIVAVHLEKGVNHFLPCPKCGRRYKNEHTLIRHLYLCGKEPDLQCDYCPHKTNMKSSLERHIVAVHLEKEVNHFLPCSKCGKRYKNQQSLKGHEALCGKEPQLQCDYCSYKTNLKQSMKKHILAVHLEKEVNYFLPCSKCGKRYKNQQSLSRHSSLCGQKPHLQCDYCSYKTNMKSSLAKHITAVHMEKNVNLFLSCSKCGKRYKNKKSLTQHSFLCGKESHLQCDYCPYKTNLKQSMTKHIMALHLERKANYFLPCRKCGGKYKNEFSLKSHATYCGKKASFKCQHCSHITNRKSSLEKHILLVHSKKNKSLRGWSKYKNKSRNKREK